MSRSYKVGPFRIRPYSWANKGKVISKWSLDIPARLGEEEKTAAVIRLSIPEKKTGKGESELHKIAQKEEAGPVDRKDAS